MKKPERKIHFFNRLRYLLIIGIAAKTLVDSTTQIFNPFLVIIGTGVGIGTVAMGRMVAIRSLMGLSGPFLGSLADKLGYRRIMRISLVLTGAGMIIGAVSGNIYIFAFSMVIGGIGQIGFVPSIHAYISSRLPYEKRALGLGIIEFSWALAGICGLFVSGLLIDTFSWNTPFYLLGGGLIFMSLIFGTLPTGIPGEEDKIKPKVSLKNRIKGFFDFGDHAGSVWANASVSGLNLFAMMHVMIIHGGWLENEYGLRASSLGVVALLLGIADLIASVVVSLIVDRVGKKRSVITGVIIMAAGFLMFPFFNRGVLPAIIGLFIPRMGFEYAMVSNFPLLSEQYPEKRGQVLGLGTTMGFIGTTIAGLTGPVAYLKFGVWGLGPVSLAASLASLFLLVYVIKERPHVEEQTEVRE